MSQPSCVSFCDVCIWSVDECKQSSSCFRNKFYMAFMLLSSAKEEQKDFRHRQLQHSPQGRFLWQPVIKCDWNQAKYFQRAVSSVKMGLFLNYQSLK